MQHFFNSKLFKVIFTNFFAKNKNSKIQILRGEPYFFKKINIRSPGGELAMVLQYHAKCDIRRVETIPFNCLHDPS